MYILLMFIYFHKAYYDSGLAITHFLSFFVNIKTKTKQIKIKEMGKTISSRVM